MQFFCAVKDFGCTFCLGVKGLILLVLKKYFLLYRFLVKKNLYSAKNASGVLIKKPHQDLISQVGSYVFLLCVIFHFCFP